MFYILWPEMQEKNRCVPGSSTPDSSTPNSSTQNLSPPIQAVRPQTYKRFCLEFSFRVGVLGLGFRKLWSTIQEQGVWGAEPPAQCRLAKYACGIIHLEEWAWPGRRTGSRRTGAQPKNQCSRLFDRLRDDSFSMRSLWLTESNAFLCLEKIAHVKFQSQKRSGYVQ